MGRARAPGRGAPVRSIARALLIPSCRLMSDGPIRSQNRDDLGNVGRFTARQEPRLRRGNDPARVSRMVLRGVGRAGERLLELVHDVVGDELAAAGASARAAPEGHQDQREEDEPCTPGTDRAALRASACRHHWFGRAAPAGETRQCRRRRTAHPIPAIKASTPNAAIRLPSVSQSIRRNPTTAAIAAYLFSIGN